MLKIDRLTRVFRIRGVDVYVHWSVLAIAAVLLFGAIRQPLMTLIGLASYVSVLFIHEAGHMIVAQRKGCAVSCIDLYPIFGVTHFSAPWSRVDSAVIAWGGVLAQSVIAVPLIAWVRIFGYSRFEPANAVFALLGFFSLAMAAFNLLPVRPLDGAIAWDLFPALIQRARNRRMKRAAGWRSFR